MDPQQIVRVHNTGETEWSDRYDSKLYTIAPGESRYVPIGACATWLGNPNDTTAPRETAVEKVKLRYGYHDAFTELTWDEARPKLEVFDQSTDERIWFPADDPEGKYGTYTAPDSAVLTDTRYEVNELKRQLSEVHELLKTAGFPETRGDIIGTAERVAAEPADSAKIPVDKPGKPRIAV